jgi:putative molybdopterin biosynthesis protein
MEGIDFIPLQEERFDLVIRKEMFGSASVQTLLKILNSPEFHKEISHFSGNDYRDLGKIVGEV